MNGEDLISVSVPAWLLGEVYEFIARRMSEGAGHVAERRAFVAEDPAPYLRGSEGKIPSRSFRITELGLLKRSLPAGEAARVLLELCALEPDVPVPFEKVVSTSGLSANVARGQLGAFTKVLKRLFNNGAWPIRVLEVQGQASYLMDPMTARNWADL